MTNILLVDPQQMVCEGIEQLFKKYKHRVIASVAEGQQALRYIHEYPVECAIVDYQLTDMDGATAIRQWKQANSQLIIIGLSQSIEPHQVTHLLQAGAQAYVSKCSSFKELMRALEQVQKNEVYLCPLVAHKIALHKTTAQDPLALFLELSDREREVMQMIVKGQSVAEIAAKLFISAKTVCSYRYRLFAKLGVKNDVELTRFTFRHRLVIDFD